MVTDPLKLKREAITISEGREMNIYTFELDGKMMPEMRAENVEAVEPEKDQVPHKPEG